MHGKLEIGTPATEVSSDTVMMNQALEEGDTWVDLPSSPTSVSEDADRSSIANSFVGGAGLNLDHAERQSRESLLNQRGLLIRPLNGEGLHIERFVRERLRLLLPVYNQEKDIGRTIDYVTQELGVPHEHIVASSCSTDGSNAILQEKGVTVLDQYETLRQYLDVDRFLGLMAADDMKQLRGKGLTMFAGHVRNLLEGGVPPGTFTIQTDTDIKNIGTHEGGWDPVTYFSRYLAKDVSIDAIKASKNGRNNQPMHIFFNTLPSVNDVGYDYQKIGADRWILTGEYGWKSEHTERLRWATGYAIETILAMSQVDLGLKRRQVEMPQSRTDGQNFMTKETVMYSDIQRTALEIVRTGQRLHDLSVSDIATINGRRARQSQDLLWMAIEKDENPGPDAMPNKPVQIQPSRLIPDIRTLIAERIVYAGG